MSYQTTLLHIAGTQYHLTLFIRNGQTERFLTASPLAKKINLSLSKRQQYGWGDKADGSKWSGKEPGAYRIGGWVGPIAIWDV